MIEHAKEWTSAMIGVTQKKMESHREEGVREGQGEDIFKLRCKT